MHRALQCCARKCSGIPLSNVRKATLSYSADTQASIARLELPVHDVEAVTQFCNKALLLKNKPESLLFTAGDHSEEFGIRFVPTTGGSVVHGTPGLRCMTPWLAVSNISTVCKQAERRDGKVVSEPTPDAHDASLVVAHLESPDGYPIAVVHRFRRRPFMNVTLPVWDLTESGDWFVKELGMQRFAQSGRDALLGYASPSIATVVRLVRAAQHEAPAFGKLVIVSAAHTPGSMQEPSGHTIVVAPSYEKA